jgi:DNA-binding MarR family transcriptional regulator
MSVSGRTPEGELATTVLLKVFRANGLLLASGDGMAAPVGLTAARWQVLGAVVLEGRPMSVPGIARRMGLTRQSVQASVNRLLADGMVEAVDNDAHQRSPLFRLTTEGRRAYAHVDDAQRSWINRVADGLSRTDLAAADRLLQDLIDRLDHTPTPTGGSRAVP